MPQVSTAQVLERELTERLAPTPPQIPDDPAEVWPSLQRVGARASLTDYVRDLWRWRSFIVTVPLNDLRAQNQDTMIGQLWLLLNPLLLALVYYVIFGIVLGISRGGVENYPPFLIIGVIMFNFTRTSIRGGSRIIARNRKLVQSINFPRAALPISALIESGLSQLLALAVMFALLPLMGITPAWTWLLVVPIAVIQLFFNLGLGLWTARFGFHFKDTSQFLPYVLRIWFYMSGVLVPIEKRFVKAPSLRFVLENNPIYIIIDIARDAYMYQVVDPVQWRKAAIWAVVLCVTGFLYFRRAEHEYGLV